MGYLHFVEDVHWIWSNYHEFQKLYPDQFVAIKHQEVITAGSNQNTVIKIARHQLESVEFIVEFIESGESLALYFDSSIKTNSGT